TGHARPFGHPSERTASWLAWGTASVVCFCFQAEDGIRVATVTGVQTCALPISGSGRAAKPPSRFGCACISSADSSLQRCASDLRSEERRVGEEGRPGAAREGEQTGGETGREAVHARRGNPGRMTAAREPQVAES